jgi:hypothetical protein
MSWPAQIWMLLAYNCAPSWNQSIQRPRARRPARGVSRHAARHVEPEYAAARRSNHGQCDRVLRLFHSDHGPEWKRPDERGPPGGHLPWAILRRRRRLRAIGRVWELRDSAPAGGHIRGRSLCARSTADPRVRDSGLRFDLRSVLEARSESACFPRPVPGPHEPALYASPSGGARYPRAGIVWPVMRA